MRLLIIIRTNLYVLMAFTAFLLFISCQATKEFKSIHLSAGVMQSIDSLCALQLERGHFPGLAVAIAEKNKRLWSKGYGYANLELKERINAEEDLFRIGSISKTVTASALARLYEKDEIDLALPISTYCADWPEDILNLSLEQLGGHLGGIRHYNGFEFLSNIHYSNVIAPLDVFIYDTLLCKPDTKFNYSTYGWTLISAVMQMAADKPFLDIIEEEVIVPLHLSDLKADQIDSTAYRRVSFYELQDGVLVPSPLVDNSNKWAGGGFICSAEDLGKFGYALLQPGFLKEETLNRFTLSQFTTAGEKTNYGIGFSSGTDVNERAWYGHSGGSVGGTSMLRIYPHEDVVIVTLVNLGGAMMDDLAGEIAAIMLKNRKAK